ncbi:hypothetical protein [Streptomyces daliensis]|uniref:Uncharacterized protein n=1 Tax=Streptomyces daliensis TaxID=299421 RepID=A0A8T4IMT5_9ACTN|nr:hypothetical protein [Streptomyces daliensis]
MNGTEDDGPAPRVREIEGPREEARKLSSQLYELLRVKGRASEGGPGVIRCEGRNAETFYRIAHPWSLSAKSPDELKTAMAGLKEDLPRHGWKIVEEGRSSNANRTPYFMADSTRKRFTLKVTLEGRTEAAPSPSGEGEPEGGVPSGDTEPLLSFHLVSDCYQVPEGEKVDTY